MTNALKYHKKHFELADDAGKFVACTNVGLVLGSLGKVSEAAKSHQDALRLAIKLQSTYGQSLAVGNLSLLASRQVSIEYVLPKMDNSGRRKQEDYTTANACMDQHLQLVQTLNDFSAESRAWTELGILADREHKHEQAARYFEQAYNVAANVQENGTQSQALCHMGIALGNQAIAAHTTQLLENIQS